jgi:hypothetical protein
MNKDEITTKTSLHFIIVSLSKISRRLVRRDIKKTQAPTHSTLLANKGRASTNHTAKTKTNGKKKEGSGSAYVSWW